MFAILIAGSSLAGCVTDKQGFSSYGADQVALNIDANPTPASFSYCHSHGCEQRSRIALDAEEWKDAVWRLIPEPATAAEERQRLAWAAGDFERVVARKTGTSGDLGGSFSGFGKSGQLDCIDESLDMTLFLRLLDGQGLLRFHRPASPLTKGNLFDSWPHYTASMIEFESGQVYALDSWYFDNGEPALVLRSEVWLGNLNDLVSCMRDGGEAARARKTPAECGYS